mmetsp:Transcript_1774/g.3412  ORF Transcript_1774/g.3412 Transcript_1774/m.3412 type:complete len:307 (-) Transcript_1774:42-962(-)
MSLCTAFLLVFAAVASCFKSRQQQFRLEPQPGCEPAEDSIWIIGTHHKTGTVYSVEFANSVGNQLVFERGMDDFKLLNASQEHIFVFQHFSLPWSSGDDWDRDVEAFERFNKKRLRIVHHVRDPLEMILSAYFYHYECPEEWTETHHPVEAAIDSCTSGVTGHLKAPEEFCLNAHSLPRNESYCHLLQRLTPEQGVLLETWHSINSDILPMIHTHRVLSESHRTYLNSDLGSLMSNCTNEGRALSDFLGSPLCEQLACDLVNDRSTHSTSHLRRTVQLKEDLKKALKSSKYFIANCELWRKEMGYL